MRWKGYGPEERHIQDRGELERSLFETTRVQENLRKAIIAITEGMKSILHQQKTGWRKRRKMQPLFQ